MNKQRKTSNILNVFQYDETTGAVTLPSTLVLTAPAGSDNSTKVPTTAWTRTFISSLGYVTGNQSISITGDATGSGTTSIEVTLANTAVTSGTYGSATLVPVVTVDSKGRITNVTTAAISGALTFTGEVTGTGTTGSSTTLTLANSGVTAGTYTKVTVDSKGRVTVGASATTSDISESTNLYYTDARVLAYLTANNYATQSYVGTQIANLVDAAPGTLDTLNELAAALGDDPNFATTISTSIGTKVPQTRTITINGTSYDLSANRSWTINSMVYPSAGIALSTGTAWGTSITDNSSNWNTSYGWGNHASAGYLTSATAATTYASLTGSYANPSWITSLAYSKLTGVPSTFTPSSHTHAISEVTGLQTALDGKQASGSYAALSHSHAISDVTGLQTALDGKQASLGFTPYNSTNPSGYISSYTETDTLATVTARGATTSTNITLTGGGNIFNGHHYFSAYDANGNHYPHYNAGSNANGSKLNLRMFDNSGNAIVFHLNGSSKAIEWNGNTVYHSGNLTNLNQLTNGPGYLTSVTAHNQAWSTITSTPTTLSGYGISDATIVSPEYTGSIGTDGWYTIATYGTGRAVGTFHIYDDMSSRHNYVEAKVNWSFGHGGITIINNGRYGTTTIRHIRLLYNTADQTYGGVKIQVNCINASFTLRIRKEYPNSLTGWGAFTEITPVLENSPSGWAEYSRASEVTSERGSINTSSSVGYLAGNTILQSANYSSYALPLSGGSLSGKLQINANWGGTNPERFTIRGTYPSIALRSTNYDSNWLIHNDSSITFYYAAGVDSDSWGVRMRLETDGTLKLNGNTVIHAGTIGSQSVSNATTAGGLAVHGSRNNEANKIVRTDANGYIQAGWINTPSGAFSSAITKIYCSDDDYIRYQTPANFISNLGLITTSNISSQTVLGVNAQFLGTGSINVSYGYSTVLRNENGSGANTSYSPTLHMAASDTMWQIQGTYGTSGNGTMYFRQGYSGSWGNWLTMISSANIGAQSVAYASNAGSVANSSTTSQRSFDYLYASSYLESGGAVYGTIFYDNNDRGYYLDPNTSGTALRIAGSIFSDGAFGTNGASSGGTTSRIFAPKGAAYSYTPGGVTGAIKIRLPIRANDTMWSMKVRIYDYNVNKTSEYLLGNYAYSAGAWNYSATYLGGSASIAHTVRFGNEGGYDCVWIGETSTGWSYPVISVMDFMGGYANGSTGNWQSNWEVTIVSSFGTVGASVAPNINFNEVYAYSYRGNSNVAGTGTASYHPSGIYSTGTNWLYGTMYMNGNSINDVSNLYSGAYYATNWFRAQGDCGLYSQDYGGHFRRSTAASHGTWEIFGYNKGGYGGINIIDAQGNWNNLMFESGNGGLYQQNGDGWLWYWSRGNSCLGVGSSSTTSGYKLRVNGATHSTGLIYCESYVQASGAGYFGGDVTAYYSDVRLKENVKPLENVLDKISKIGGYTYTANDLALELGAAENKDQRLGVLAQEIKEVFPEVVAQAPFDRDALTGKSLSGQDYMTVKYERLVPVLIEAIKEQQLQIEDLKNKLELLTQNK